MTTRDVSAFAGLVDLAAADLGGEAVEVSDEFFAPAHNLLQPGPAVWDADRYTDDGKWMDGWESRRRRVPGHDWCLVRLGVPGYVVGVDVDTQHFTGNYPAFASIDACNEAGEWMEIVPQFALRGDAHNLAAARQSAQVWTHVRLNIFPAGGVARLRVYGESGLDESEPDGLVDLAGLGRGGQALACSDMFFSPMSNLLRPDPPAHMGEGWETRRSRPPGEDWMIVLLGRSGTLDHVLLDTAHFKGNHPSHAAIDAICWPGAPPWSLVTTDLWTPIVDWSPLGPDPPHQHAVDDSGPWTHVRMRIQPDGGVARLRVMGRPANWIAAIDDPLVVALNRAEPDRAAEVLGRCCGSTRWVAAVLDQRPFCSRAHLLGVAEDAWWRLQEADWLEAFGHHPRIGADVASLRERFGATAALSEAEQAGVAGAEAEVLTALAEGNAAYDARFGHVFLVCASGRSATEMLDILRRRLDNERQLELRIAAGEQAKITRLRLAGLTGEELA